jgi:hypothetical protein
VAGSRLPQRNNFKCYERDRRFFGDFAEFADVVNRSLADKHRSPWRLQELSDNELKLCSQEYCFGRRYDVFHNQACVGSLEVSADYDYSAENPNVCASIELENVRLLDLSTIQQFLSAIVKHICNDDPDSQEECIQASQNIDRAVTQVLWDSQQFNKEERFDQDWGGLILELGGTAYSYRNFSARTSRTTSGRHGSATSSARFAPVKSF